MARRTCDCGRSLPDPGAGGGRPRTKCEVCKPPRSRPGAQPPANKVVQVVLPMDAPMPEAADGRLMPESVYSATLNQLAAAGREHTAAGAAALALARQLDISPPTAPSVSNALLKALDMALAGAKPARDALDELANRRSRKAAGA